MEEKILQTIAQYGLETVCIALCVNLLTAVIKLPVKKLAKRAKNGANVTRFIVFLPLLLGFALSILYVNFIAREKIFGKEFMTLWVTSSSLSLTFYAVFDKLIPPKNKAESDAELKASKEVLDKIQAAVNGVEENKQTGENNDEPTNEEKTCATGTESAEVNTKIILRGKHDG